MAINSLKDFEFKTIYAAEDSPVEYFLKPCLYSSRLYLRAAGYFSSAVFRLASREFAQFFLSGGTMRLVCSPFLTEDDARELKDLAELNQIQAISLRRMLENEDLSDSAKVLAYLVHSEKLELRFAITKTSQFVFHEKFGLFSDGENRVSFIGSNNETLAAWADYGNSESFDVFVSWKERDLERICTHQDRYSQIWNNEVNTLTVLEPSDELMELVKTVSAAGEKIIEEQISKGNSDPVHKKISEPLPYQKEVLCNWHRASERGLVKFCTGAGKTAVALFAIKWAAKKNIPVIVMVPSKQLLSQWADEIQQFFDDALIIKIGGGNNSWKARGVVERHLDSGLTVNAPRIIIAVMASARSEEFLKRARIHKDVLVVVDEVHQIGADQNSQILTADYKYRLALSATPDRYGDPDGTARIYDYFGEILEPVIEIPDAIKLKRLVPYRYSIETVGLNDDEIQEWELKTKKIRRLTAIANSSPNNHENNRRLKMELIARSRIAKKADRKIPKVVDVLLRNYNKGEKWLVYLEDSEQVAECERALKENGISTLVFDGETVESKRQIILESFTVAGGVILSMKCLDEGVDIPSVSHAIVVSSSQNPRQFVQRRGRVLRHSSNKKRAYIWDVLVIPSLELLDTAESLLSSEIARAYEFATFAENIDAIAKIESIIAHLGKSLDELLAIGEEAA